jgi:hypothetical protein
MHPHGVQPIQRKIISSSSFLGECWTRFTAPIFACTSRRSPGACSPGVSQTVTAASDFSVPGNGRCHLLANLPGSNVTCRYPFRIAAPMMIHAAVADAPCGSSGSTHPGIGMLGARSPMNGPDPTIEIPLHLGGAICPGTQITFTPYHRAENFRLELDIPSILLDQYMTR